MDVKPLTDEERKELWAAERDKIYPSVLVVLVLERYEATVKVQEDLVGELRVRVGGLEEENDNYRKAAVGLRRAYKVMHEEGWYANAGEEVTGEKLLDTTAWVDPTILTTE